MTTKEFHNHWRVAVTASEIPFVPRPWNRLQKIERQMWAVLHALVINGGFGSVTSTGDKTRRHHPH